MVYGRIGMKKTILIGGCSFSQYQGPPDENYKPKWKPWTDLLMEEFEEKFKIINRAQSSFGQGMIAQTIIEELIRYDFKVDYVVVQWSAVGRSYGMNKKDFIDRVVQNGELQFAPHLEEYVTGKSAGEVTGYNPLMDIINETSSHFYSASLIKMLMLKSLLEHKNIPYTMFWGWQQITPEIAYENKKLIDLIYDDNFWRFNEHGGMNEYIVSHLGKEIGLVGGGDFHPSTAGQKFFYDNIVKSWKFLWE